jgi:hypothetical protein
MDIGGCLLDVAYSGDLGTELPTVCSGETACSMCLIDASLTNRKTAYEKSSPLHKVPSVEGLPSGSLTLAWRKV